MGYNYYIDSYNRGYSVLDNLLIWRTDGEVVEFYNRSGKQWCRYDINARKLKNKSEFIKLNELDVMMSFL